MKALIMALAAIASQPKQQFDLVCTAPAPSPQDSVFQPVDLHLRIDLNAKHWCKDDCKVIHNIAEVQPATIWLEKESEAEQIQHLMHWSAINRETGDYAAVQDSFVIGEKEHVATRSHCAPAAFSGFPKVNTEF